LIIGSGSSIEQWTNGDVRTSEIELDYPVKVPVYKATGQDREKLGIPFDGRDAYLPFSFEDWLWNQYGSKPLMLANAWPDKVRVPGGGKVWLSKKSRPFWEFFVNPQKIKRSFAKALFDTDPVKCAKSSPNCNQDWERRLAYFGLKWHRRVPFHLRRFLSHSFRVDPESYMDTRLIMGSTLNMTTRYPSAACITFSPPERGADAPTLLWPDYTSGHWMGGDTNHDQRGLGHIPAMYRPLLDKRFEVLGLGGYTSMQPIARKHSFRSALPLTLALPQDAVSSGDELAMDAARTSKASIGKMAWCLRHILKDWTHLQRYHGEYLAVIGSLLAGTRVCSNRYVGTNSVRASSSFSLRSILSRLQRTQQSIEKSARHHPGSDCNVFQNVEIATMGKMENLLEEVAEGIIDDGKVLYNCYMGVERVTCDQGTELAVIIEANMRWYRYRILNFNTEEPYS